MTAPGAAAKAELRRSVLEARAALGREAIRGASRALCAHLRGWPPIADAATLLAYVALRREPHLGDLIAWLGHRGRTVLRPVVRGAGLAVVAADSGPEVAPAMVDVALIPGLAFDPLGRRLGRGGGHYDRLLPLLRPDCLRIGVCFELQRVAAVPEEPWDQRVDAVVTEAGIWEVGPRARER